MNNNFNFVFFIMGILIGILICHYKCNSNIINSQISHTTSDTTHSTYIDTSYYSYIDTIPYIDSSFISSTNNSITSIDTNNNIYTTVENFKDSTDKGYLDGNLTITTYGYSLKDWDLNWKYNSTILDTNKNIIITIKDSVIIETTNTIIEKNRKLYAGIEIDIQPINHIYLGADYLDKKGNMFGIAVGTDLNEKQMFYKIGYKRLINFK